MSRCCATCLSFLACLHTSISKSNSTTDGEGARLRPDVVINLPGGRCIVVDSKVALSGYLDAVEATDDAARELHLKKHLAELKSHVKNLASKEYQKHVPDTAEFVVLFVPGENFPGRCGRTRPEPLRRCVCAEGHSHHADDDGRAGEIHRLRLALVEDSAKNSKIAELGREMHGRMAIMVDKMAKVGDSIEKSVKSYNEPRRLGREPRLAASA